MGGKSKHARLDQLLADELGLQLQDQCLTVKHVQAMIGNIAGLFFAFWERGTYHYDQAPLWKESLGCRVRPERFLMHPTIKERLNQRFYARWYFQYGERLYRVQVAKTDELYTRLWCHVAEDVDYTQTAIIELESMFLRKKPLMHLRTPPPSWSDRTELDHYAKMKKRA